MSKLAEDLVRVPPEYPDQYIHLTLPVPPSVNHMYQSAGRGRRLTKDAMNYIRIAQEECKKKIKRYEWKKDAEGVWYVMDLYYFFPDRKTRDSHNTLKILTDALEGLIFSNDYFVLPRIQNVTLDRDNPRLELILYPQTKIEGRYVERINDESKSKEIA